jgi:hypothetical protein
MALLVFGPAEVWWMGQIALQTELLRRSKLGGATVIILSLIVLEAIILAVPQESHAIPAWARKYNADCAMCHYAAYPRLNSFGLEFRRMGYRTPNEVNKDQDIANVNNYLSGRIRTQFAYDNTKGTTERTEFQNAEISLLYGGAISRHWSAYIHGFTATGSTGSSTDFHGHGWACSGYGEVPMVQFGQMHMLYNEESEGSTVPSPLRHRQFTHPRSH